MRYRDFQLQRVTSILTELVDCDFHFFYHSRFHKSSSDKSWAMNYNFVLETKKSVIKLNRKGRIWSSTIIKLNCVDSMRTFSKPVFASYREKWRVLDWFIAIDCKFLIFIDELKSSNWRSANLLLGSTEEGFLVKLDPGNKLQLKNYKRRRIFHRNFNTSLISEIENIPNSLRCLLLLAFLNQTMTFENSSQPMSYTDMLVITCWVLPSHEWVYSVFWRSFWTESL